MPDELKDNEHKLDKTNTPNFDNFSKNDDNADHPSEPTTKIDESGSAQSQNSVTEPIVNSEQPVSVPGSSQSSTKKSFFKNKKTVIAIIIAAVVLLGAGSALAYVAWYQNPKKILADSLINAVTAKSAIYAGTISFESRGSTPLLTTVSDTASADTKVSVEIIAKQADTAGILGAKVAVNYGNKEYSVNGDAIYSKSGDVYFKVENIDGIVAEAKKSLGASLDSTMTSAIDKIVKKIDGTWIKISNKDLKEYSSESSKSKTCLDDTIEKFKNDKTAIAEVTDLYSKNPFIVIDKSLGEKDGSFGYKVKSDSVVAKAFAEGLKSTKIYKSLNECDSTFTINASDFSKSDDLKDSDTVEIWVGAWSHKITRLTVKSSTSDTTFSATVLPKYDQKVEITAPASSISVTELKTYIEELFQSMYSVNTI
jgi:hypothetical protein